MTIGGGDDLWLYLNGKFVMEISSRNMGTSVPCRKISLSAASNPGTIKYIDMNGTEFSIVLYSEINVRFSYTGGSYITPQYGFVSPTTGLCVITSTLPAEQVLVELEVKMCCSGIIDTSCILSGFFDN